eukprot:gene12769-17121_t
MDEDDKEQIDQSDPVASHNEHQISEQDINISTMKMNLSRNRKKSVVHSDFMNTLEIKISRRKLKPPKPSTRIKDTNTAPKRGRTTQRLSTAAPAITPLREKMERVQNEMEISFIEEYRATQARVNNFPTRGNVQTVPSYGETVEIPNLNAAVRRGVKESSSILLDWTVDGAKWIGSLCRVYWSDDKLWYIARVLYYCQDKDLHYIYYLADNAAEWIHFEEESAYIAEEVVWVSKSSTNVWPSLRYMMTEKAKETVKKVDGYHSGGVYIEYFSDVADKKYEFVAEKKFKPFSEPVSNKNKSKQFEAALNSAHEEQHVINSIKKLVYSAVCDIAFVFLRGPAWIGTRVSASGYRRMLPVRANKIDVFNPYPINSMEPKSQEMVTCDGTITKYSGALNEYLIVFDDDSLQPRWFKSQKELFTLLLDRNNITSSSIGAAPTTNNEHAKNQLMETSDVNKSNNEVSMHTCLMCNLCNDGDSSAEDIFDQCDRCYRYFHPDCSVMNRVLTKPPITGFDSIDSSNKRKRIETQCWDCVVCTGCRATLWDAKMLRWNITRVEINSPDNLIDLCGNCLNRFKNLGDFCTVCFKLYDTDESMLPPSVSAIISSPIGIEKTNSNNKLDQMIHCDECARWIHAYCEGIDDAQYLAMTNGSHPIWGDEYLCPLCRVKVCQTVIGQLEELDTDLIFCSPVTEDIAKNYFDIIRNPMDLSTMLGKATRGDYKATKALRQDFELMCLNALVFNRNVADYFNYAKDYYFKGESLFDGMPRKATSSAYGYELYELLGLQRIIVAPTVAAPLEPEKKSNKKSTQWDSAIYSKGSQYKISSRRSGSVEPSAQDTGMQIAFISSSNGYENDAIQVIKPTDQSVEMSDDDNDDVMKEEPPVESLKIKSSQIDSEMILPHKLTPSSLPPNYISFSLFQQTLDAALFTCCQDICSICGSSGTVECMLFCMDCGECFHSFCIEAPLSYMSPQIQATWRCMNCKICEICCLATDEDNRKLVFCEKCDKSFHTSCVDPPIVLTQHSLQFYCQACVTCSGIEPISSKDLNYSESESLIISNQLIPPLKLHVANEKHSWGMDVNKCYSCSSIDQLNKIELKTHQERLCKIIDCAICHRDCYESNIMCTGCHKRTHLNCNALNVTSNWTNDGLFAENFLCSLCCEKLPNLKSHVGTGETAAELLIQVAKIQRIRHQQRTFYQGESALSERMERENLWSYKFRFTHQSVIIWAMKRLSSLERTMQTQQIIQLVNPPKWIANAPVLRLNACRFINFVTRKNRLNIEKQWMRRSKLCLGLNLDDIPLDSTAMIRLAHLAAAFLHCSGLNLSQQILEEELSPIARDVAEELKIAAEENNRHQMNSKEEQSSHVNQLVNSNEFSSQMTHSSINNSSSENNFNPLTQMPNVPILSDEVTRIMKHINTAKEMLLVFPTSLTDPVIPDDALVGSSDDQFLTEHFHPDTPSLGLSNVNYVYTWMNGKSNFKKLIHSNFKKRIETNQHQPVSTSHNTKIGTSASYLFLENEANLFSSKVEILKFRTTDIVSVDLLSGTGYYQEQAQLFSPFRLQNNKNSSDSASYNLNDVPAITRAFYGIMKLAKDEVINRLNSTVAAESSNILSITEDVIESTRSVDERSSMVSCVQDSIIGLSNESSNEIDHRSINDTSAINEFSHTVDITAMIVDTNSSRNVGETINVDDSNQNSNAVENISNESTDIITDIDIVNAPHNDNIDNGDYNDSNQSSNIIDKAMNESSDSMPQVRIHSSNSVNNDDNNSNVDNIDNAENEMDVADESVDRVSIVNMNTTVYNTRKIEHHINKRVNKARNKSKLEEVPENSVQTWAENIINSGAHLHVFDEAKKASIYANKLGQQLVLPQLNEALSKSIQNSGDVSYWEDDSSAVNNSNDNNKNAELNVNVMAMEVVTEVQVADPSTVSIDDSPYILPLKGWCQDCSTESTVQKSNRYSWKEIRKCCLCHESIEDNLHGRLVPFPDGVFVHVNCVRWCSEVYEEDGFLMNAMEAKNRSIKLNCAFCHQKGAGVGCQSGTKCKRNFHLRCAIAAECMMMETMQSSSVNGGLTEDNSEPVIHTVVMCPEHYARGILPYDKFHHRWKPYDPIRCIVTSDIQDKFFRQVIEYLSLQKADRTCRYGSLTIFNIGRPTTALSHSGFHSNNFIYPRGFKSCRIYWSMNKPYQRTAYILDILADYDLEGVSMDMEDYIRDQLTSNDRDNESISMPMFDVNKERLLKRASLETPLYPLFRVVAMDQPNYPIFSRSLDTAYNIIISKVKQVNKLHNQSSQRKSSSAFGLNSHHFFGIGISFVREAIESVPSSIAAMICPIAKLRYMPSYVLPTAEQAMDMQKLQLGTIVQKPHASLLGSSRADYYTPLEIKEKSGVGERRITRILTKITDSEPSNEYGDGQE